MMSEQQLQLRPLAQDDWSKGYNQLLNQLSPSPPVDQIDFEHFWQRTLTPIPTSTSTSTSQSPKLHILVIEDISKQKLVGHISLLLEPKLTRGGSWAAHIEDVVVDLDYRGLGLARKLVEAAVSGAKLAGCYKTILNCRHDLTSFYKKLGFRDNGVEMRMDLDDSL